MIKENIMKAENTIIFLFFAWLIGSIFFGEHIPAGNGLGWDGVLYANLAQHFPFQYQTFHIFIS